MKLNVRKTETGGTHEGAKATTLTTTPEQALRRCVLSCLLWESEFYEDGVTIAERIANLAVAVPSPVLAALAVEARTKYNLRHIPLLLLSVLADTHKGDSLVPDTIASVINRADELAEFLTVFCTLKGTTPDKIKSIMTHGIRRGLAKAFLKFDAYQLAKYNRDGAIRLRDVLFLCHPKPPNDSYKLLWEQLINGTLASPDTWEVELSAGKDKGKTFSRLMSEGKLGYLALLRNIRNMVQSGVDDSLIRESIVARKSGAHRVLPFRFTAAARICPQFEPELDKSLQQTISDLPKLTGRTVVLVDVSGSMDAKLSAKSDLTRMDAAATLASIVNSDHLRVFTFSNSLVEVSPRRGMAGVDAVIKSQHHSSTNLGSALHELQNVPKDRLIVITDEQSTDLVTAPKSDSLNYLINVASSRNGVSYGSGWKHIDGFSENVIRFIVESESSRTAAQLN